MSDTVTKVTKTLFDAESQSNTPSDSLCEDPCLEVPASSSSELTVLFPEVASDPSKKTVPAMGGSIVKLSFGSKDINHDDTKYKAYYGAINDKERVTFGGDLTELSTKHTSAIRVAISKLYTSAIFSDANLDVVPSIFLSSSLEAFSTLDDDRDYFGTIRKNAKFAFIPIESITKILEDLSKNSSIASWPSISGKTFFELYDIAKNESSEEDIIKLIMDMLPFINLSEDDMRKDSATPPLAGYFTIINKNIYLKMPDFSGFDSAGYGGDYIYEAGLNFLFQIIQSNQGSVSVKNIELNVEEPIAAEITDYTSEYDIKAGGEFTIDFTANAKPGQIYLSPVINDKLTLKNDISRGIYSSQSKTFVEYTSYPNPFKSIFGTTLDSNGSYVKTVDLPFSKISSDNLASGFDAGFPMDDAILAATAGLGTSSLSIYELVGNLSRQNLILHNGIAAGGSGEKSSGKASNNAKYFKKEFVSNPIGLCENYRPRALQSATSFKPSTWITSSGVTANSDGTFTAKFSQSSFKSFFGDSVTEMKFVAYAWDGSCQISKISNGYLNVTKEVPSIDSIKPNGSQTDGIIINCIGNTRLIKISTTTAESVDSVLIGSDIITRDDFKLSDSTSILVEVPCTSFGFVDVTIASGSLTSDPVTIYISDETITNTSLLPKTIHAETGLTETEASDWSISTPYDIPICYGDPRAKIKIKNKNKAMKRSELYLYLAFADSDTAKALSANYVEVTKDYTFYVAKDFYYKLGTNITGDFYKQNNTTAFLYFPGTENGYSNRPLSLLASLARTAYFVISSRPPGQFSASDNLGIIKLGDESNDRPAFVASPLIIGMAAKYSDGTISNNIGNFGGKQDYVSLVNKLIIGEFGNNIVSSLNPSIDIKDKFTKLVILFQYRDLAKFKKKNFKLYIKDAKVGSSMLFDGVKPVSSVGAEFSGGIYSGMYYVVAKNMLITSSVDANVRIDIYDPDFSINNTTQNKVTDFSITTEDLGGLTISADPNSTSAIIASALDISDPLAGYKESGTLTGLFADNIDTNSLISFGTHPMISISSNIAGSLVTSGQADSDPTINLLKSVNSELISSLPVGFFKISSGAEISNTNYLTASNHHLIFLRITIPDICKLAVLKPEIIDTGSTGAVIAGNKMSLRVKNILQTFIVEIFGVEAKVVGVKTGDDGISNVTVIIPEGVTTVAITDCCVKLYNGNQTLNGGIGQFGKGLVGIIDRQASGMLNQITNQFEKHKDKLLEHPLKFISNLMNHANIEPAFMKSFCDFSFKLTANLSVNLQGFSQLLVPVRVILCIIDVICNILNPFQLPSAIIRLFDCLYDLILLLPQISIPVMFLSLLLHLLDLLECIIVKVMGFITIINLVIDAMITLASGPPNFRDLLLLEELLLKYVISLEADLELLGPIVQILAIFLELLGLTFRFPCSINPNSLIAPCGIDGFEIGAMVSGLIAEQSGTAPHATYVFKKEYLIPISQPFTRVASEVATAPSYNDATEPIRGLVAFDGSVAVAENIYDLTSFNPNSLRKKDSTFDSTVDDITDITTDTYVSLAASYTRRRKTFESSQSVIFKFDGRSWKSAVFPDLVDKQIIDETKAFDTPVVLLSKDSPNINVVGSSAYGNFYSLMDGKAMMGDVVDGAASVIPLTIDIIQDGATISRTFDTIPAMLLLDEEFNVYVVNEGGILFGEYKQLDGTTVTGITEIRATVINRQSSHPDAFDKEDEVIGTDDGTESGTPITKSIFSLPQLYFVDTRVAADAIQSKCQTASINQLPLDLSGDGGLAEVQAVTGCLQDFLASITDQTKAIKDSLSLGKMPSQMSSINVDMAYGTLLSCTNNSIDNVCSIVVNPLNSSFLLEQDEDLTPILPDPSTLSDEILSGFESSGPSFTGAREYAGGIGDAVTLSVGTNAKIEIIPRDSYDNLMYFDMSDKIRIDIVSDTTGSASMVLVPTDLDAQNYLTYDSATRSYSANLSASSAGEVKIKASVCNQPIQALTYSDLVDLTPTDSVGCVPSAVTVSADSNSVALGALSRVNRILTITFIDVAASVITGSASDQGIIITEPQLFGSGLIN